MTWTITIKVPWMWLTSPKCEWTTRHLSFFFFFPSKICLTFETFVFSYKVLHLNSTLWGVFEHFLDTLLSHSITYYSKHNIHSLGWSTFFKNYRTFCIASVKSLSHFATMREMKLDLRMSFLRMFFFISLEKNCFNTTWSSIFINKS